MPNKDTSPAEATAGSSLKTGPRSPRGGLSHAGTWRAAAVALAAAATATAAACSTTTIAAPAGPSSTTQTTAGPGVTDASIDIGVEYVGNLPAAVVASGAIGPAKDYWTILVDDVNARGGVNGRKLNPVFHMVDVQSKSSASALMQSACAAFTQDHPVSIVLSGDNLGATYSQCIEKAGAAHVMFGGQSTSNAQTFTKLPHYVEAGSLNLDRFAAALIPALSRLGYFEGAKKVGILTYQDPAFDETVTRTLKPALQNAGVRDPQMAALPLAADDAARASQMASTVVQFKSAGVDRVVVLENNGTLKQMFMTFAAKQQYTPRYAMSSGGAQMLLSTVPPAQLKDAVGIGWLPHVDVPPTKDPGTPGQKACLNVLAAHGVHFTNRNAEGNALGFCDMFNLTVAALSKTGKTVNADTFIDGVNQVQGSVPAALVGGTSFSADQHDGVNSYRDLAFDTSCTCFSYTSGPRPLP